MKLEIVQIGKDSMIEVVFVASYAHMSTHPPEERWVYVDNEKEAADLYIQNHVRTGDIVVTQDIGLASMLLPKNVNVLSPKGMLYKEEDMDTALDLRFLSAKARRQGNYGKGPKPFSREDRLKFINTLTALLSKFEK